MASQKFEAIVDDFEFLDDWEDRYRHVIELGRAMPDMPDAHKSEATRVIGCASNVWIWPLIDGQGPSARIGFEGESDAMIVRGLIAVLHALYDGVTAAEAVHIDTQAELARLGLDQHLSAQRSNGLRAMSKRLADLSAALNNNQPIAASGASE